MANLEGKVALVTGASRGIGRAIAIELGACRATVAVNYVRNRDAAEGTARAVEAAGGRADVFQADVAVLQEAQALVQQAVERFGGLDFLVNNAGVVSDRTIRRMTGEEWGRVVHTNLDSVFYCTNAALPHLISRGGGRIVNMASVLGQTGNTGQVNYSASKGGIIAFTKGLALEVAHYNILVNAVCPGYIETDMMAGLAPQFREGLLNRIPLKRFGAPEEVARLVRFLVTEGDYVTGQQFNINGGMYM
ncbi:MAG: 3-oxoacyl-ACP reductase FabG [Chloroflexi bacterium]|nr:3-oxoacyl-ACP reductase FabG [Chloroflexota bacterium]